MKILMPNVYLFFVIYFSFFNVLTVYSVYNILRTDVVMQTKYHEVFIRTRLVATTDL